MDRDTTLLGKPNEGEKDWGGRGDYSIGPGDQPADYGETFADLTEKDGDSPFSISALLPLPSREERSERERQKELIKRTLLVVPATLAGYWALDFLSAVLVAKYAPKYAIWARRAVEMVHSVVGFLNATRGAFARGRVEDYDYVWSAELGYYFYEMSKVSGMDMLHHIVSVWSYASLLLDTQKNKDPESSERRNFFHSCIMMGLHFAEPWKDVARFIPNRPLKNFVWLFHHFAYTARIALWPFLMVLNNKMNKLEQHSILNAPLKCTIGSVIFFLMNCYWFWLKVRKFSFPE